jgi:hypothetical protein
VLQFKKGDRVTMIDAPSLNLPKHYVGMSGTVTEVLACLHLSYTVQFDEVEAPQFLAEAELVAEEDGRA